MRLCVVAALIGAAFAASFAASAVAADFPTESNMVLEPFRLADRARDVTNHWLDRAAVPLHTSAPQEINPYLMPSRDLYVTWNGVTDVINVAWPYGPTCYTDGCCSNYWYESTIDPGWYFQFCAYEDRGWFTWRRFW
jgi:hypothetical protein